MSVATLHPLPPEAEHTPAAMGRAIVAYLSGLGVERPHLAGNSLGAWVALEIAADGAARSVCAISPAGLWRRPLGPRRFDSRARGRRPSDGYCVRK